MEQTARFRPMRRKRQQLDLAACAEVLERGTAGVLSLSGDNGYPYGVPLSYAYVADPGSAPNADGPMANADGPATGRSPVSTCATVSTEHAPASACAAPAQAPASLGRLIFHSARTGHKIDAILRDARASFCVIDQDRIVPEEFTTYFRSVIAFGRVRIIERDAEKRTAAELLAQRYAPGVGIEQQTAEIDRFWKTLTMLEMEIEHLSGKEAIELVRARAR